MATASVATRFVPVAAETGQGISLAMQRLWLTGRILPVGARLLVHHTFRSSESKPIEVIYAFGLPRDAALRRFRVSGGGFSVRSELKAVEEALRAYEEGIQAGHLASLARQYGDGLINLTLGNIRPGETVTVVLEVLAGVEAHDDGIRLRFPFTLAPGYHRQARAAEVAPGVGEIELPEAEFGDLILPQFAAEASDLHEVGFDLQVWVPQEIEGVASPSHALRVVKEGRGRSRASLATERDVPDRDLVLEARAKDSLAGVLSGVDRGGRGRFAAIVPSTSFGERGGGPRQVVFVLDRSGSMGGQPLAQACKALEACLGALGAEDRFGLVAFDNQVEVFRPSLTEGTSESREQARQFLKGIDARGGTELAAGVVEAARLLGKAGGDLLVLTDGQVFGTEVILAQARQTGARIHCLGIGSASQDRFLALLARETGGVSRFLTPRERVDLPAVDLFASVGRPAARDLEVKLEGISEGQVAPEPPRAVFAGTPLVVFGESEGVAQGQLVLQWDGGRKALPLQVGESTLGETLRLLTGARLITDLESRYGEAGEGGAAGRRREGRLDQRLEALSQTFGLASRRMALVAVVERAGDRPGEIPETKVVPVGMPQDTQFGSYFRTQRAVPCAARMLTAVQSPGIPGVLRAAAEGAWGLFRPAPRREPMPSIPCMAPADAELSETLEMVTGPSVEDTLLDLAARIEPDGGMPGRDEEERVQATILALLCFLAEGHTERSGTFRSHVARLMAFLETAKGLHPLVGEILELGRQGRSLEGDWSQRTSGPGVWKELEAALRQ